MDKESNNLVLIQKKDEKLKDFFTEIQRLFKKKNNTNFDIIEVFFEAKSMGYYPKIIREILVLRKMNIDESLEQQALLNTYKNAIGMY